MKVKKIFKGFVSNEFENPILIPINELDANYLTLEPIYNDVGGVILSSPNGELLEDMIVVDFKGFTDGSPTKSFSINAKDSLPNSIYLNFYQNGTATDGICNREYIEVVLLQEVEVQYTSTELSKIYHALSVLEGGATKELTNIADALRGFVGAPRPRPRP